MYTPGKSSHIRGGVSALQVLRDVVSFEWTLEPRPKLTNVESFNPPTGFDLCH